RAGGQAAVEPHGDLRLAGLRGRSRAHDHGATAHELRVERDRRARRPGHPAAHRRARAAVAAGVAHRARRERRGVGRPWRRALPAVHVARAADLDFAPLISWRGAGLAEPVWPEPPVDPFAGGVLPPGSAPARAIPLPLSAAVVVPDAVLSASVSVALRCPPALGANTRPTWHEAPGATVWSEQVSVPGATAKSL